MVIIVIVGELQLLLLRLLIVRVVVVVLDNDIAEDFLGVLESFSHFAVVLVIRLIERVVLAETLEIAVCNRLAKTVEDDFSFI